jgi:Skp family chaperone for outer membrane proteins
LRVSLQIGLDSSTFYAQRQPNFEQEEKKHQAELERMRAELAEIHEKSRREALDRPAPSTVRAYQAIYARDPNGWPPA